MIRTKIKRFVAAGGAGLGPLAHAHPGHGDGFATHWHAGDATVGLLGLAIGVVALWLLRRK